MFGEKILASYYYRPLMYSDLNNDQFLSGALEKTICLIIVLPDDDLAQHWRFGIRD